MPASGTMDWYFDSIAAPAASPAAHHQRHDRVATACSTHQAAALTATIITVLWLNTWARMENACCNPHSNMLKPTSPGGSKRPAMR